MKMEEEYLIGIKKLFENKIAARLSSYGLVSSAEIPKFPAPSTPITASDFPVKEKDIYQQMPLRYLKYPTISTGMKEICDKAKAELDIKEEGSALICSVENAFHNFELKQIKPSFDLFAFLGEVCATDQTTDKVNEVLRSANYTYNDFIKGGFESMGLALKFSKLKSIIILSDVQYFGFYIWDEKELYIIMKFVKGSKLSSYYCMKVINPDVFDLPIEISSFCDCSMVGSTLEKSVYKFSYYDPVKEEGFPHAWALIEGKFMCYECNMEIEQEIIYQALKFKKKEVK